MGFIGKISRCFTPFLAMAIFVSSISCAIDFHYCQGQLKSFNLFGKAKNCHEIAAKKASCPHHAKVKSESLACSRDKDCCTNKTVVLDSDVDLQIVDSNVLKLNNQFFVAVPDRASFRVFLESDQEVIPHARYKPPLILKDISILYDTFLL